MTRVHLLKMGLVLLHLGAVSAILLRAHLLARAHPRLAAARFLRSSGVALIGLVALEAGAMGYVGVVEPNWITVTHLRLANEHLAHALTTEKIVQVSDLHVERFGFRERAMVRRVNEQHADWIVITGDLLNERAGWPIALQVIGELKATHGVWVIPGNTDNALLSAAEFEEGLRGIGAHVLRNTRAPLGESGAWLVGVDDPVERRDNLSQAIEGLDQAHLTTCILLAHSPDIMAQAVKLHLPLVLVGHTHGGQVGIGWLRRLSPYANRGRYMSGEYREQDTVLYVNRGIGSKTRPYRFLAPPELLVLEFIAPKPGRGGGKSVGLSAPQGISVKQELWLSDFETADEHAVRWEATGAFATRSTEHATHGRYAAKVTFQGEETQTFSMRRYLSSGRRRSDWSGYDLLRFDLYNPERSQEHLILEAADIGGGTYKKELVVPAEATTQVSIPVNDLRQSLDLWHIARVTLSQKWQPRVTATFYLDAVRLQALDMSARRAIEPLWLADFESDRELAEHWELRAVKAVRSSDHATHGRSAVKVTFADSVAPSFVMERYLATEELRNWSPYDTLAFSITNPQSSQERLILQLKDRAGHVYKEDIVVGGEATDEVQVRLADVQSYLDVRRISQLNLFRWQPGATAEFYIDAIRLEPERPGRSSQRVPTPRTPAIGLAPKDVWQVGWESSLTKVFREPEMFQGHAEGPVRLSLARGEYESVQLVLIGGEKPSRVAVSVGPITQVGGSAGFPANVVEVRKVGYVKTKPPAYAVTHVGDWADPLPRADEIEVPAGKVQPVWLTIGAPITMPSGRYEGEIAVTDSGGRAERLALQVRVFDFALPLTSHLTTAFDFYRPRLTKAYRETVPGGAVWEGRMDELERRYYLDLLKHRIWPMLQADPLSSRFGSEITGYLQRGLGAFSLGTRGGSHGNNWPTDPVALEQVMVWYRQAAAALTLQHLLGAAYVYAYDEPKPGDREVARVMEAIHRADPGLKNLLVMHEAPNPQAYRAWLKDADILCLHVTALTPEMVAQYQALGKEVWVYVSSPSRPFPSLVIDDLAITHRILPWLVWKTGATGLLYWCVNFWNGDPWANPANFAEDQNGNGSLYYPTAEGPVPSIRLEVLRDGIEDYEYLVRLKELLLAAKARGGVDAALLAHAEGLLGIDPALIASLRSYAKDPEVLLANRQSIAETIEKLQRVLR